MVYTSLILANINITIRLSWVIFLNVVVVLTLWKIQAACLLFTVTVVWLAVILLQILTNEGENHLFTGYGIPPSMTSCWLKRHALVLTIKEGMPNWVSWSYCKESIHSTSCRHKWKKPNISTCILTCTHSHLYEHTHTHMYKHIKTTKMEAKILPKHKAPINP